jgi:uncharacterized membrane protein YoaK (UPF0700 family)
MLKKLFQHIIIWIALFYGAILGDFPHSIYLQKKYLIILILMLAFSRGQIWDHPAAGRNQK